MGKTQEKKCIHCGNTHNLQYSLKTENVLRKTGFATFIYILAFASACIAFLLFGLSQEYFSNFLFGDIDITKLPTDALGAYSNFKAGSACLSFTVGAIIVATILWNISPYKTKDIIVVFCPECNYAGKFDVITEEDLRKTGEQRLFSN